MADAAWPVDGIRAAVSVPEEVDLVKFPDVGYRQTRRGSSFGLLGWERCPRFFCGTMYKKKSFSPKLISL